MGAYKGLDFKNPDAAEDSNGDGKDDVWKFIANETIAYFHIDTDFDGSWDFVRCQSRLDHSTALMISFSIQTGKPGKMKTWLEYFPSNESETLIQK